MVELMQLSDVTLAKGAHYERGPEMCVMEAAAWIAGEEHSARPRCVCPAIGAFMVTLNDKLPSDADRERLLGPFIDPASEHAIYNTARDGHYKARGLMLGDWLAANHRWRHDVRVPGHPVAASAVDLLERMVALGKDTRAPFVSAVFV